METETEIVLYTNLITLENVTWLLAIAFLMMIIKIVMSTSENIEKIGE